MNWFHKYSKLNKFAEFEEQKAHFDTFYQHMKDSNPDFDDEIIIESWLGYIPDEFKVPSPTGYKLKPQFWDEMRRHLAGKNILLSDEYKANNQVVQNPEQEIPQTCQKIKELPWRTHLKTYVDEYVVDSHIEDEDSDWRESLGEEADLEEIQQAVNRWLLHLRKRWCPNLFRRVMGGEPEIADPKWKRDFKEFCISSWGYNPFEGEDWEEATTDDDIPSADDLREQWGQ